MSSKIARLASIFSLQKFINGHLPGIHADHANKKDVKMVGMLFAKNADDQSVQKIGTNSSKGICLLLGKATASSRHSKVKLTTLDRHATF